MAISILPLFIVIKSTYAVEFTYYVGLGVIYSIGWAAVQISHMSLVPSFTEDRQRRDRLNNLRNSFTFAANFIVLGLGLIIFSAIESQQGGLFLITAIGLGLGIAASIFFLWKIKEKELVIKNEIKDNNT